MPPDDGSAEAPWFRYVALSDRYFANARVLERKSEYSKATEMLWGAVAEMVKAAAAVDHVEIKRHDDLGDFVEALSVGLQDPSILNDFADAESLHRNFYEGTMRPSYMPKYFTLTQRVLTKLLQYIAHRAENPGEQRDDQGS